MTPASSSRRRGGLRLLAGLLGLLAGCQRGDGGLREATVERDTRPFTPWHRREAPLPFPKTEWFWQDLFAEAPEPEPLPADVEAAARLKAAFERVATLNPLQSEDELPAMAGDARRDPRTLFAALDDARPAVRFAAARLEFRLSCAPDRPFPQRLAAAAAAHLRDPSDEVALLHLETVAR